MRKLLVLCIVWISPMLQGEEASLKPKSHIYNVVLEARHLTVIYSQITSPILKVEKRMGDSFMEGDLLMALDRDIYAGNLAKAEAAVVKFQTELSAKKRLYEDDALSKFEMDEVLAQLAAAEAEAVIAKKMLDNTDIKAPYHGRVVKVSMKEFELAQAGKELMTIVDDTVLYAKFLVPSTQFNCLRVGAPLEVYVKETGQKVNSAISGIAPVIDPASSTILVEARLENEERTLYPGMTGRVVLKGCEVEK